MIFEQKQEQVWFLNKSKSRVTKPESCGALLLSYAMSSLVGGHGSDWEMSEAEEKQTGAVHSSASACWGQLTHAGIKTDTSTVQSYREVMLLQKPARLLDMSHLSPMHAAKSPGNMLHMNMH